jgi:hypothetical protein
MKLLIIIFLQVTLTSALLGQNIPLSTLFSNTLSLCSSLHFGESCKEVGEEKTLSVQLKNLHC